MKGCINRIHLLFFRGRDEINAPDIILISSAFVKDGADIIHQIFLQFGIGFHRNFPETEFNMLEMKNGRHIIMQILERPDIHQQLHNFFRSASSPLFCALHFSSSA